MTNEVQFLRTLSCLPKRSLSRFLSTLSLYRE